VTRDDSGLFSPFNRNPVLLPRDVKSGGLRGVGTTIAIITLVAGIASGLLYQRFWQTASHEAERLLPASTLVHIHGSKPAPGLGAALKMAHLRDVSLTSLLQDSADNFGTGTGAVLGPLARLLSDADDVHFASVPAADAVGFLVMVEFRDDKKRLKHEDALTALMEPVDRELGFTVHELRAVDAMPWAPKTLPLRMVSMEPWLVFSLGPRDSLSQLLQARVSGTTQPIRNRRGYARLGQSKADDPGDVVAYLAPGALHDALRAEPGHETLPGSVIEIRRALMVEGIEAFTAHSELIEQPGGKRILGERLTLTAHLEQSDEWPLLTDVFARSDHRWVESLPVASEWIASLSLQQPDKVGVALQSVTARVEREFGRPLDMPQLDMALEALGLRTPLNNAPDMVQRVLAFSGNVRMAGLSALEPELAGLPAAKRWSLSIEGAADGSPEDLANAADAIADAIAGQTHAIGTLYGAAGARPVYIALPHPVHPNKPATRETLAWRIRDNVLEVAPNREVFAAIDRAVFSRTTLGADVSWRSAAATLPEAASGLLVVHPALMSQSALGAAIATSLVPEFRLVGTLQVAPRAASLEVNLGIWTSIVALARAPRQNLSRLLLPTASPSCLSALDNVCRRLPRLAPCSAWGRLQPGVVARACQHLTADGPI